jgi:putative transposase
MTGACDHLSIPLPNGWPRRVRSAILHVISLAQYSLSSARGWASDGRNSQARQCAEAGRLEDEVAMLREEIRIKDARMGQIEARCRPHYPAIERMAILELKAARGWSKAETARRFLVKPATVAFWMGKAEEEGTESLVRTREPVNKFPAFVQYIVRHIKVLCPSLGKVKIAGLLARAGIHLAPSSVWRMIHKRKPRRPAKAAETERGLRSDLVVTAKRPNHVHHVDLTTVPTRLGMWVPWLPFSLPQVWPFCWWIAIVLDHFSRRAVGAAVFRAQPTSEQVRAFLGRLYGEACPKHLICDKGGQFWCEKFKDWCRRLGIKPRFGAVGKSGSIAVLERFIRTLKDEWLRQIVVPIRQDRMRLEVHRHLDWYNEFRPHMSLGGRTPNEVFFNRLPANELPRFEPRPRFPRDSLCAAPYAPIRGRPGQIVAVEVRHRHGRLPVVVLKKAS